MQLGALSIGTLFPDRNPAYYAAPVPQILVRLYDGLHRRNLVIEQGCTCFVACTELRDGKTINYQSVKAAINVRSLRVLTA